VFNTTRNSRRQTMTKWPNSEKIFQNNNEINEFRILYVHNMFCFIQHIKLLTIIRSNQFKLVKCRSKYLSVYVPAKLCLCQFLAIWQRFSFLSRVRTLPCHSSASHFYVKAVRSLSSHKSPAFMFLSVILCHFLSYKRWEMFICVLYTSYTNYVCL
jgi:hypothetical protein